LEQPACARMAAEIKTSDLDGLRCIRRSLEEKGKAAS
jgi:hypothetical protein